MDKMDKLRTICITIISLLEFDAHASTIRHSKVLHCNIDQHGGIFYFYSGAIKTEGKRFKEDDNSIFVNLPNGVSFPTALVSDCLGACTQIAVCKSVQYHKPNKTCRLLNIDVFVNKSDMINDESYDHYNLPHACSQKPCQNGGTCIGNYIDNSYTCECKVGYVGDYCQHYDFESLAELYLDFNEDLKNRGHRSTYAYNQGEGNFHIVPARQTHVLHCPKNKEDCIAAKTVSPECLQPTENWYHNTCGKGFTFGVWFQFNPYKYENEDLNLFTTDGMGIYIYRMANGTKWHIYVQRNKLQHHCYIDKDAEMLGRHWVHLTVRYKAGKEITVFLNGEVACHNTNAPVSSATSKRGNFRFGSNIEKYIDDFALYALWMPNDFVQKLYEYGKLH